jgi:hypothetical protein
MLTLELLSAWEDARILVRQLEITLHTARRVLWTLSVVTVRKRHDETRTLHPLNLTRGDELIDDTLGVVGEVTELGLPHNKRIWRGQRVTVLEAETTKLRQGRVRDNKLALVLADVLERSIGSLALLVVEDGMALREGTTLNILTGNTDVVTLRDERTEGQSLSCRPVNVLALINSLDPVVKDTLQVAVNVEILWCAANDGTNVLESVLLNSGWQMWKNLSGQLLWRLEAVPRRGGPLLRGWSIVLALGERLLKHAPNPLLVLLNVLLGEDTILDELVGVDVNLWILGVDAFVHEWLGERWLIGLVVAVLSVADKVDNNIRAELGTPVSGKLADIVDGLNIISVDVEDWGIDGLGDIGTVCGGTSETWVSGETNLVVHNHVDGTAGGVGWERVEAQALVNDTLRSERSITMEQDTHGSGMGLFVVVVVLDGTGLAENDWILSLQMGWVGNKGQLNTLSRWSWALEVHTQMVLDISRALILSSSTTRKLAEDRLVWLADDVGENVKTTTMWHADDNILDAIVDGAVDQGLHTWDKGLATLKTEPLVVWILGGRESLETAGPDETIKNSTLLINGVLVWLWDLNALPEPVALLSVRDVNVLDTVGAAVKSLAGVNDFTESHLLAVGGLESWKNAWAKGVLGIKVLLGEAVVVKGELLWVIEAKLLSLGADAERIDASLVVTTSLVGANKKLDLQVVGDVGSGTRGDTSTWHERGDTSGWRRHDGWWWLESLGHWHIAALHILEVDLPRLVNGIWVLLPGEVHLVDIVRGAAGEEAVVGAWRLSRGGSITLLNANN